MTATLDPVDDRTGLIRWVVDIPIEPGEPRVFNASVKMADVSTYNGQRSYDNNGGSGLTPEDARGAAVGEGLERYCCAVYAADELVCGKVDELRAHYEVRGPADFALFPDADQASRLGPFAWTWSWSLSREIPVLVPACMVYMPYFPCFPDRGETVPAPAVSTGLACAASRDQAVLGGVYECIERDAFMITWLNRLAVPNVDPRSYPALRELHDTRLARRGLRYLLFDTTTDIPVPSFLCLLVDEVRDPPMICAGGAAHLDPVRAAAKAMLEAVQTREWAKYLGDDRHVGYADDYHDVTGFEDHVRLYAYSDMRHAVEFLLADVTDPASDWRSGSLGQPGADLARVVELLRSCEVETLATDLTTPDVRECGLWVTRSIAPELQPLDAMHRRRFLGGRRLYDVPVRMGHVKKPTTVDQLNPYPHPYP